MKIVVKTIPHLEQRYDTCGDWWFEKPFNLDTATLQIRVSDLGNPYYEFLIAYHEQYEAMACIKNGVEEKTVSAFDKAFEQLRTNHPEVIGEHEPGDMVSAPYHKEHKEATALERLACDSLGVDWNDYEQQCGTKSN